MALTEHPMTKITEEILDHFGVDRDATVSWKLEQKVDGTLTFTSEQK